MDGLGGYADAEHGTELEEAVTPNLDQLAAEGVSGLCEPVGPGITPGSGPGHLGLFGYDPQAFELGPRRALGGRPRLRAASRRRRRARQLLHPRRRRRDHRPPGRAHPRPEAQAVVEKLQAGVHLDGAEVFFRHEREHRLLVVLRGPGLDPRLTDTDPQATGTPPLEAEPLDPEAKRTAELAGRAGRAGALSVLADEPKANYVLLRGFDTHRELPSFADRYGLRAAAVAIYPMYRGIASLLGMDVLGRPQDLDEQLGILRDAWGDYDYFFLHHKYTDSAGEDGDRARKIAAIETLDARRPRVARARARRDRGDRRPLDAVAAGRALVAPGARRCCGASAAGATTSRTTANAGASAAASASARPRTSWPSCSPTPTASRSTAPSPPRFRPSASWHVSRSHSDSGSCQERERSGGEAPACAANGDADVGRTVVDLGPGEAQRPSSRRRRACSGGSRSRRNASTSASARRSRRPRSRGVRSG